MEVKEDAHYVGAAEAVNAPLCCEAGEGGRWFLGWELAERWDECLRNWEERCGVSH